MPPTWEELSTKPEWAPYLEELYNQGYLSNEIRYQPHLQAYAEQRRTFVEARAKSLTMGSQGVSSPRLFESVDAEDYRKYMGSEPPPKGKAAGQNIKTSRTENQIIDGAGRVAAESSVIPRNNSSSQSSERAQESMVRRVTDTAVEVSAPRRNNHTPTRSYTESAPVWDPTSFGASQQENAGPDTWGSRSTTESTASPGSPQIDQDAFSRLDLGRSGGSIKRIARKPVPQSAPSGILKPSQTPKPTPSTGPHIEFDEDEPFDHKDDTLRKVEFHQSQISQLLKSPTTNIGLLYTHLQALVERYGIQTNYDLVLYLAVIYMTKGIPLSGYQILQDFRYEPQRHIETNLQGYLLRAKAAYKLEDYNNALKDAKRMLNLLRQWESNKTRDEASGDWLHVGFNRYSTSIDQSEIQPSKTGYNQIQHYQYAACQIVAECAARKKDEADSLYYKSIPGEWSEAPTLRIGSLDMYLALEGWIKPVSFSATPPQVTPERASKSRWRVPSDPEEAIKIRNEYLSALFKLAEEGNLDDIEQLFDDVGTADDLVEFMQIFYQTRDIENVSKKYQYSMKVETKLISSIDVPLCTPFQILVYTTEPLDDVDLKSYHDVRLDAITSLYKRLCDQSKLPKDVFHWDIITAWNIAIATGNKPALALMIETDSDILETMLLKPPFNCMQTGLCRVITHDKTGALEYMIQELLKYDKKRHGGRPAHELLQYDQMTGGLLHWLVGLPLAFRFPRSGSKMAYSTVLRVIVKYFSNEPCKQTSQQLLFTLATPFDQIQLWHQSWVIMGESKSTLPPADKARYTKSLEDLVNAFYEVDGAYTYRDSTVVKIEKPSNITNPINQPAYEDPSRLSPKPQKPSDITSPIKQPAQEDQSRLSPTPKEPSKAHWSLDAESCRKFLKLMVEHIETANFDSISVLFKNVARDVSMNAFLNSFDLCSPRSGYERVFTSTADDTFDIEWIPDPFYLLAWKTKEMNDFARSANFDKYPQSGLFFELYKMAIEEGEKEKETITEYLRDAFALAIRQGNKPMVRTVLHIDPTLACSDLFKVVENTPLSFACMQATGSGDTGILKIILSALRKMPGNPKASVLGSEFHRLLSMGYPRPSHDIFGWLITKMWLILEGKINESQMAFAATLQILLNYHRCLGCIARNSIKQGPTPYDMLLEGMKEYLGARQVRNRDVRTVKIVSQVFDEVVNVFLKNDLAERRQSTRSYKSLAIEASEYQ